MGRRKKSETAATEEESSADRISVLVDPDEKHRWRMAAVLSGHANLSEWIRAVCTEKAAEVLKERLKRQA